MAHETASSWHYTSVRGWSIRTPTPRYCPMKIINRKIQFPPFLRHVSYPLLQLDRMQASKVKFATTKSWTVNSMKRTKRTKNTKRLHQWQVHFQFVILRLTSLIMYHVVSLLFTWLRYIVVAYIHERISKDLLFDGHIKKLKPTEDLGLHCTVVLESTSTCILHGSTLYFCVPILFTSTF